VFVGGYARTGSTLLDRLLGQIDGMTSFGELRHIWERGFVANQLCGCGLPFRACPYWTEVARVAFGGFDGVDAGELGASARSVDSFWNIPRLDPLRARAWPPASRRRLVAYGDAVSRLYAAMQKVSGARFLIDSTKDPQHAYLLRSLPGFDVRMVHLVRDARAVAHSWTRTKRRPEIHWREQDMPRYPILRSALAWDLANLAAGRVRPRSLYTLVRYEDLMRDPRAEIGRVVQELHLGPVDLGFLGSGTATLGTAHTVAGNPMRFQAGPVQLRLDERWRTEMRGVDRAAVTALTAPGLLAYGYGLRSRSPSPSSAPSASPPPSASPSPVEMARILRLAVRHRQDPMAYARAVGDLAVRFLGSRLVPIEGRWLDVGTGNGVLPLVLQDAGADPCVGLDVADRRIVGARARPFVAGHAERLPFADGSFDGVVSSNVLEHTPHWERAIRELVRVCAPGGYVYLSWTNWYSPLGGHEWSPMHYLGAHRGARAYERLRGTPPPWNVPGRTLFPVHVGPVLRLVDAVDVEVIDVAPRYWPSLRMLARLPVVREVALWNCVVLMRRRRG
jgi:SAM-dependent methyltransferase